MEQQPLDDGWNFEVRPWDWTARRRSLWYGDSPDLATTEDRQSDSRAYRPCVIGSGRRSRCVFRRLQISSLCRGRLPGLTARLEAEDETHQGLHAQSSTSGPPDAP